MSKTVERVDEETCWTGKRKTVSTSKTTKTRANI
jgi:hypothetical protein